MCVLERSYASVDTIDIDVCQKCGVLSNFLYCGRVMGISLLYLPYGDVTVRTFTHVMYNIDNLGEHNTRKKHVLEQNGMKRIGNDQLFTMSTLFFIDYKMCIASNNKKTKNKNETENVNINKKKIADRRNAECQYGWLKRHYFDSEIRYESNEI